jgi:hypothetical protein
MSACQIHLSYYSNPILSGQFSNFCPVTLTSIQDGHLQWTYCSFNIDPMGKNVLKSSPLKPVSQFKANMGRMVLRWSTFKIMSCDPDPHPRWQPLCYNYVCWRQPFWTEIGITEHNFGSWPPKYHRWHVCYIGLLVSEEKILKHFFP